jgi:acetolactate synthase-1/2/3 large subunit
MRSVADVIVHHLAAAGVNTIFGVPGGGSNLDLIAAAGRAGLRFILTATETAGAIAAIAQAEITGCPGACLSTLGPGVASIVNGVACASLDRAPIIVFTDAPPASASAFAHQRVDHHALLAPVSKWSATLTPDSVDAVMATAVARALAYPRGPVHIDCPADVLGQAAQVGQERQVGQVGRVVTAEGIDSIVAAARRPLLLVGLGARDRDAATAVRELCASHDVGALVTYKAKGVVSDGDPHFAGVFTNGLAEADVIVGADLLIGVGLDPIELLPRAWPYRQPIINVTPYEVACDHVPFATQFVGDVAAGVRRIAAVLRPAADRTRRPARVATTSASSGGLAPGRVVELVAAAFPDARVTVDAGAHMFPATLLWPVAEPGGMLISNGLSTMGFALPAAIGAAVIDPGPANRRRQGYGGPPKRPAKAEAGHYGGGVRRQVVALTGDGGLLMCAGELLTAAREHLPIVVVVFNDAALTLIDIKQRQREQPIAGVALGSVKWYALAQSMGVAGHTAATEDELRGALAAVRDADGPSLIEAMIDPRGYDAMFKALRG